ncbi:DUF202 domain-containing protein [Candidatus Roizmanbacteria bacterium]|nr:DUF202 domain-containing protein [Candidatus Roizmanbacteria bacterium]
MQSQTQKPSHKQFTVRDDLAINRSVLANERTFLAYLRTSATFLIAGISLLKFFDTWYAQFLGLVLMFGAGFIAVYGIVKYEIMKGLILEEQNAHHAKNITNNDTSMLYVPKIMWDMLQRAYTRLTPQEK